MTEKERWLRRAKKLDKKKQAMHISGRSVFTLQEILRRKAERARQGKARQKELKSDE